MLIDWFTVAAQIVNFLILVFLLKRFLYGRIVKAMDEREARIAARLETATEERRKAEGEAEFYRQKNEQFDAEREEMLSIARKEAQAEHKELMHQAREEVASVKAGWLEALRTERQLFLIDLRGMIASQVCSTARRALQDLANVQLEQQILEVFTEKLRRRDPHNSTHVSEFDRTGPGSLTVRSAFEIPLDWHGKIAQTARECFGNFSTLEFHISSELICGIELRVLGHKIAWSLADYLEGLEEMISALIKEETQTVMPRMIESDPGERK